MGRAGARRRARSTWSSCSACLWSGRSKPRGSAAAAAVSTSISACPSDEQLATAQDILRMCRWVWDQAPLPAGRGRPPARRSRPCRRSRSAPPTPTSHALSAASLSSLRTKVCPAPFMAFVSSALPLPFPACLCRPRAWYLPTHGCRVRVFPVLELPCTHIYCETCILPWLRKSNSCPVCRHELETETGPTPNQRSSETQKAGGEYLVAELVVWIGWCAAAEPPAPGPAEGAP